MRATPAPRIASHVERAGGEYFLKLDPARAQSLFVHVLRDGLEHRPRGLEAVTQRIVVGERALDAAVEQSGFEIPVQVSIAAARNFLLRRSERRIEIERDTGLALQQRAPHHDRVVDREQRGLGVEAAALSGGRGKKRTTNPPPPDGGAVDQVPTAEKGQ